MEEDKGGAATPVRASSSAPAAPPPPPPPPPPSHPSKESTAPSQRQRFSVELRPGETTIVSWRRLLKDSKKGNPSPAAPSGAHPALESRIAPAAPAAQVQPAEGELQDSLPPPNRFSAVIEKIERLYVGQQSSEEEELDAPDDDQYDTEDSFIDDAELDEYFQVDNLATKHNGFFVNRGNLEQIEPSSLPNLAPKKRRRKDSTKSYTEKDGGHISTEHLNMGNVRMKAAARSASLVGKNLSSSSKTLTPFSEHYQEGEHVKNKLNVSTVTYKKRSADYTVRPDNPPLKMPHKDSPSLPLESKDLEKQKAGSIQSRDISHKSRGTGESFDTMFPSSRDKVVPSQVESQSKKLLNGENETEVSTKIRRKERNTVSEFPDMNSYGSVYPTQAAAQSTSTRMKEGPGVRPKGTTLERAIRDLEKIVVESKPPNLDVQEVDTSFQGVKRRLPHEVKQKLAKVARLSASQGKVSVDELIDRLMGILGHLVQRKTLKRNMKEMVEIGLSAKQQKDDRFQQVKKEVNDMLRTRISLLKSKVAEQQDSSTDDFQEGLNNGERRALKGKCSMDDALEDKICDLYDLYVEGMDEDKGPQSRKLYVELAELWPNGYMDNLGIKEAINRSKERKRALYRQHKVRAEERIKRKRLASATRIEESASLTAQARLGQERPVFDSAGQVLISPDKLLSNQPLVSSGRMSDPTPPVSDSGHHHGLKHYDKVRGGSSASTVPDDGSKAVVAAVKKKMKRKSETDLAEFHVHPEKLPLHHGKERHKSHKHSDDPNVGQHHKSSIQLPGIPGCEQPS